MELVLGTSQKGQMEAYTTQDDTFVKSKSPTVQETIRKILPDSHVDVMYDPDEPTAEDLKAWDYDTAKELRRNWSEKRAMRIAKEGWPAAAAYYAHRLESKGTGIDYRRDGMESESIDLET